MAAGARSRSATQAGTPRARHHRLRRTTAAAGTDSTGKATKTTHGPAMARTRKLKTYHVTCSDAGAAGLATSRATHRVPAGRPSLPAYLLDEARLLMGVNTGDMPTPEASPSTQSRCASPMAEPGQVFVRRTGIHDDRLVRPCRPAGCSFPHLDLRCRARGERAGQRSRAAEAQRALEAKSRSAATPVVELPAAEASNGRGRCSPPTASTPTRSTFIAAGGAALGLALRGRTVSRPAGRTR